MTGAGFPHSDTLGSTLGWQLPQAYRGLERPTSAPGANGSTVCPQPLDHKDARIHCVILNQQAPHPDQQPTNRHTHSTRPKDPARASQCRNGIGRPEGRHTRENQTHASTPTGATSKGLLPQDPTGCSSSNPAAPPKPVPTPKEAVLEPAGRCHAQLTSVSAIEHPTTTFG